MSTSLPSADRVLETSHEGEGEQVASLWRLCDGEAEQLAGCGGVGASVSVQRGAFGFAGACGAGV
jgi:hypothetical protein